MQKEEAQKESQINKISMKKWYKENAEQWGLVAILWWNWKISET